jgi:YggT family protein
MFVPEAPLSFPLVHDAVSLVIDLIVFAMLIRAIASWFRIDERYAFIRFLAYITDPLIQPARKILGRVWIIDLSFFVTWSALLILQVLLLQALPFNW